MQVSYSLTAISKPHPSATKYNLNWLALVEPQLYFVQDKITKKFFGFSSLTLYDIVRIAVLQGEI